jgi:hypothetical protein
MKAKYRSWAALPWSAPARTMLRMIWTLAAVHQVHVACVEKTPGR